jgi:hypothetical protein
MSIYTENGYESRKDYLNELADENGVERKIVYMLASMLGPEEDFDGLVTEVGDYADKLHD